MAVGRPDLDEKRQSQNTLSWGACNFDVRYNVLAPTLLFDIVPPENFVKSDISICLKPQNLQ